MALRNGPDSYGSASRALHWLMAAGVLVMLGLGATIARMEVGLANLWLFGLHKSIGLTLLALLLLRLLWHRLSPPPPPLPGPPPWQMRLARLTHGGFYVLLLLVPLSGWIGSAATGLDTVLFERWTLPAIAPASESLENAAFAVHGVLTKLLAALVLLHLAGAAKRAASRDGTLRRMISGRA